jgi:hypothetical protein
VEINSARLRVKDLDFGARCVDIVRFDYAHVYIKSMITNFEKQAYKSIRNTWNRFEELGWQPGQSTKILAKAFGISRKPSRNKNV